MNNEQAKELVQWLLDVLKQTQGFVMEQAPALAREIIAFGRVYETTQLVVAALALGCGLWYLALRLSEAVKVLNESDDSGICVPIFIRLMVQGMVCTIGGFTGVCVSLHDAILVWAAPRLYLLEYLGGLLAGSAR